QLYDSQPFGEIRIEIQNRTDKTLTVQNLRSVEALGEPTLDLGATASADRVLSDSFSEDWPALRIYDLGTTPKEAPQSGMHRAVGSQLIYNRQSQQSIFFGALSADRFLTILHLQAHNEAGGPTVASYTVDSTGTTEIQSSIGEIRNPTDQVILSVPIAAAGNITSEPVMFAAGNDYHAQLEAYGAAIRILHRARVNAQNPMGWWSWTAYYDTITEGNIST